MLVTCERKWSGDVENQMDQGTKLQFLLVSVDAFLRVASSVPRIFLEVRY